MFDNKQENLGSILRSFDIYNQIENNCSNLNI